MTISGLGNLYPTQMELLMLSGFVLSRGGIHPDPTSEQIEKTKKVGLQMLCLGTGQDFGFDVVAWYRYLLQNDPTFKIEPFFQSIKNLLGTLGLEIPEKFP